MNLLKRVGFIVDGLVPTAKNCLFRRSLLPLFNGWLGSSSIQDARFKPIVHQDLQCDGLLYELFRPWRRYDAVVFLKSMNDDVMALVRRCQKQNVRAVFDLNVDYLSPAEGRYYFDGMKPTTRQQEQAQLMSKTCDAIIADSSWLEDIAKSYNPRTIWISDCISNEFLGEGTFKLHYKVNKPIPVLWSGEAVKLFELLLIEDVLRAFGKRIVLRIVTNNLAAISKIFQPWQDRLRELLNDLNVEIIPFKDLNKLLICYDQGGVFISPRFLDNTYNMGHTEWKITLPMARGRIALCSPQPSYKDVSYVSEGKGIRICSTNEEWSSAFEEIFSKDFDWQGEQKAAAQVVRDHYSASVVAKRHADFINNLLAA